MCDQFSGGPGDRVSRRRFLQAVGLAGLGTVGALLRVRESIAVQSQAPVTPPDLVGLDTAMRQIQVAARPTTTPVLPTAPPTPVPVTPTVPPVLPLSAPPLVLHDSWALPARTSGFEKHTLTHITLHHEGVYFDGKKESVESYLRRVQIWGMKDRGWEDLPYHLLIGLDGTTYEGRPLWAKGDTNTSYNLTGHALIALVGDYDVQYPNESQLNTIAMWMAWLVQEYAIPLSEIKGHRDFFPQNNKGDHIDGNVKITCPGENLYAYLESGYFLQEVRWRLGLPDSKDTHT